MIRGLSRGQTPYNLVASTSYKTEMKKDDAKPCRT
jgi:hypothetical protein